MKQIVVVGNVVLDVSAFTDLSSVEVGHHHITPIEIRAGGGLPNVRRALDKVGCPSTPIGAVGSDAAGVALSGLLGGDVNSNNGATTEMSVIVMHPDRTILNNDVCIYVDLHEAIDRLTHRGVVVLAYLNKCAINPAELIGFLEAARNLDSHVVAGLNGALDGSAIALVRESAPLVDILVMNEVEAQLIAASGTSRQTSESSLDEVLDELAELPATVVVTLGSHGAAIVDEQHRSIIGTKSIERAETLGAGDAFLAGLALAAAAERSVYESVQVANALAWHSLAAQPITASHLLTH